MTVTVLTPDAKEGLRKAVRGLRTRLCEDLTSATKGEYQLDVGLDKARLSAARQCRRERLEAWLDEQARAAGPKAGKKGELRSRFLQQVVEQAAHTVLNRLVLVRMLEHHGLLAPHVVTGGWRSPGYASEFLQYAGPLADDDSKGYRVLLDAVFGELALELPGLFGNVGLTALVPVPAGTLRAVIDVLNDPALVSAWGDDTTLGWVYQYWNDPKREELDAKILGGRKIEPREIATKTQMFTERYIVEWLLQNSLGFTWLCICKKNGWTPDADTVLPELERRRVDWRAKREAGEVALDALLPIDPGLMADWKYFVPQPIPADAIANAPASVRDLKLLDPACGSGHFLVIAFGLLARLYEEEARHRAETWTPAEIAQRIVGDNLHGIDIDARAIQIAAAALWLRARQHAPEVSIARMKLVAPSFRLAALSKDDPARVALESELAALGVPHATTASLVDSLKGVDHLGTLLRVDCAIAALLDDAEKEDGPLFVHGAKKQKAWLEQLVATFLDARAAESDLGLRLGGEQLAAGVRFIELAREGRYDVVVGNPPYQAISKTTNFDYIVKNYPRGKADLCIAFLERAFELLRPGGLSALVTMRNWMFLGQFTELRRHLLHDRDLRALGDLDKGAFESMTTSQLISVAMTVICASSPSGDVAVALQPTAPGEKYWGADRTELKRAAILSQRGGYNFDPRSFAVIEGEPIVYWWTKEFLERYGHAEKLGDAAPVRLGVRTSDNTRFLRVPWEIASSDWARYRTTNETPQPGTWVPYVKGAEGREWMEPLNCLIRWQNSALEVKVKLDFAYGMSTQSPEYYFLPGIAFSMIGADFRARAHCYRSVIGDKGSSAFPGDIAQTLAVMNRRTSREVVESLNPSVSFQVGDVARIPLFPVDDAQSILVNLGQAFCEHESRREPSVEFIAPGPSAWTHYAQAWAQRAVDRPDGAPLPPYEPEYDPPDPEAHVSFAIGVALGRFGANGEGILDVAPKTALPTGMLFVGPTDAYPDSLTRPSVAPVISAFDTFTPASGKKPELRDWLRKDFFAYHKQLYEHRPIYFPLSSEKKSFVAWVSIHRWTEATLSTLLADHLNPIIRQLDAEIRDANTARARSDKKTAIAAGKAYDAAKRLRDELADFIAKVTQCADHGAPPTDSNCPPREVDAEFSMDLDDGVMTNSAALWPLLAPQWSDPKKWWKQLCLAEGRKDYDWAHLAKRYFPTRVDAKCKEDPSLAVAHGCFWHYHPAKAFAWELRLQDEIRAGFTIDEPGSDDARAAYLREHAAEAEAAREKERVRRERKAAKQEGVDDASEDGESGEDERSVGEDA